MASQPFSVWDFSSRLGMLKDPFINQTNNGKKRVLKLRGTLKSKKRNVQCKKKSNEQKCRLYNDNNNHFINA